MSPDQLRLLGAVVVVLALMWLHHEWHLRRYPDRACKDCGGSGKATSEDVLGRTVVGPCRRCKGIEPTTPRRWGR